jgi:hypothetical protein
MDASWISLLQWPAMAVTVLASWLVGSNDKNRRNTGFWVFLASNALWIAWGVHDHAYALITLQVALAVMNVRGLVKTE